MKHRLFAGFLCLSLLLTVGCTAAEPAGQTVCISELQSTGGDDWVELYNYGTAPVSLQGWYLSDDPTSPGESPLPAVTLKPAERLVVSTAADAKAILHFRLSAQGDTVVLTNPQNVTVQTVELPASVPGVSYGCVETGNFPPTQFVWYAAPTPGDSNENGMLLGENATNTAFGVRINEYVCRNKASLYDEEGDYGDWVELFNTSNQAVDLSGWSLTDDETDTARWRFPDGTALPAQGYLLVFCDGKNKVTASGELHANLRLSASDRFIGLYTADGTFCSGVTCESAGTDVSLGCDSSGALVRCRYPTPSYANAPETQEDPS